MRRIFMVLIVCLWIAEANAQDAPSAQTRSGLVEGVTDDGVRQFLGIPYAAPPIGNLRYRPPQPVEPWSKPLKADHFGSVCAQSALDLGESGGSEDCLTLNVYAPVNVVNAPVMVWIHGGAMQVGAGSHYDGAVLAAKQQVVVITLNYRLGVLGLLAHPALSAEAADHASGQYSLMDQQLALRWVRENAQAFGGDSHNVTVFGESAGGDSICWHLVSPQSRGLFERAIIMSGACTRRFADETMTDGEAEGLKVSASVGCEGVHDEAHCLRQAPLDALFKAPVGGKVIAARWRLKIGAGLLPLTPQEAFATGKLNHVPVMIGSNLDEDNVFAAISETTGRSATGVNPPGAMTGEAYEKQLTMQFGPLAADVRSEYPPEQFLNAGHASAQVMTDSIFSCPTMILRGFLAMFVPTYGYEFVDRTAPAPKGLETAPSFPQGLGAYHTSELAYIFQGRRHFFVQASGLTSLQQPAANRMQTYWANFARTGDPARDASWPRFDQTGQVMILDLGAPRLASEGQFDSEHKCGFWKGVGP